MFNQLGDVDKDMLLRLLEKIYNDEDPDPPPDDEWTNFKFKPNSGDPISCSLFFHRVVEAILKNILGYNQETRTYKPSILGTVQGHYAVIEEQQRKTLHIHMLVFVKEFQDYSEFHTKMQNDEGYHDAFVRYIDRLLCENFDTDLDSESSPRSRTPYFYMCPPLTTDNWKTVLHKEHELVQRVTQQHSCQNHCLKRNGKCRYSFPKQIIKETHYNKDTNVLEIQRNDSHINTNLPIITALCRSNNDIQFLPGKGDPRVSRFIAYYISNYTSKTSSQDIDILSYMMKQLETTYQTYEDKRALLDSPNKLFGSLLRRTLNHFVAGTEIGGPEAASLLLGYDDHYTGHEFVPIDWKKWDVWLCKSLSSYHEHHYNRLSTSDDAYNHILTVGQNNADCDLNSVSTVPHSNLDDYLYRSVDLEAICVWEFVSYYRFTSYGKDNDANFKLFETGHPILSNFQNAGTTKRNSRQFPTLPWFNSSSKAHGVGTEDFTRIMCFLFIPFRMATDLLFNFNTFAERHSNFKSTSDATKQPISIMLNIENNALNAKEAQSFKQDMDSAHPEVRALSSDQIISDDLANLQSHGWDRFEHHVPVDDSERPVDLIQTTEQAVKDIEWLVSRENERQRQEIHQEPNSAVGGFPTTLLPSITRGDYNEFVKSLKTPGTCLDQWNTVKLIATHIWNLCFDPENTSPIRVMLHGEGYVVINKSLTLLEELENHSLLMGSQSCLHF
jgi:hypothetical protein